MSVDVAIYLRIVQCETGSILSPTETLKILLSNGWSLISSNGEAFYKLPNIGDWTISKIDSSSLLQIFEKKQENGELIGVMMTWQNTSIGGELLLYREKEMLQKGIHTSMSFSLSSDRKILVDYGSFKITDVNWYLAKLLPIFNQGNILVEYFTYEEHI